MAFTREQKKEAYEKLSPEVQDFIMDNETTELISGYLKESNLTGEQIDLADTEILCALFGLQTLSEAINNIAISNGNPQSFSTLKTNLEENIFSKIPNTPQIENIPQELKENFIGKMEENKSKAEMVRRSKNADEIKEKLSKLSINMQSFINGGVWKGNVERVTRQFNLKPEQGVALENEVFLTLLCFEPPSDLKENIKRELGLDENAGRRIADSINGSVLGQVMGEIKLAWAPATPPKDMPEAKEPTDPRVGTPIQISQDMMRRAMKPAAKDTVPSNLPTEAQKADTLSITTPENKAQNIKMAQDYSNKHDPYRESIE